MNFYMNIYPLTFHVESIAFSPSSFRCISAAAAAADGTGKSKWDEMRFFLLFGARSSLFWPLLTCFFPQVLRKCEDASNISPLSSIIRRAVLALAKRHLPTSSLNRFQQKHFPSNLIYINDDARCINS
jgi:hypothetical protein